MSCKKLKDKSIDLIEGLFLLNTVPVNTGKYGKNKISDKEVLHYK